MKKIIWIGATLIFILAIFVLVFYFSEKKSLELIQDFEKCANHGYSVMESYPRQCRTPDNRIFIEELKEGVYRLEAPIIFEDKTISPCFVTGCSGQICSEQVVTTTCEFMEEYVCFEKSTCEIQQDGECGWSETEEYLLCRDDF